MDGQPAAVFIICLVTKQIEKLRVKNTHDKVKGIVGVADDNKQGGLGCLQYRRGRCGLNTILNLERIRDCRVSPDLLSNSDIQTLSCHRFLPVRKAKEPVLLKITGERNSLERCMLHFASYEKHTEYHEEGKYWLCSIYYDTADETELLIDILSFGPVIEVLGPGHFRSMVKNRVKRQHELLYGTVE